MTRQARREYTKALKRQKRYSRILMSTRFDRWFRRMLGIRQQRMSEYILNFIARTIPASPTSSVGVEWKP